LKAEDGSEPDARFSQSLVVAFPIRFLIDNRCLMAARLELDEDSMYLAEVRRSRGVSQQELADAIGVSLRTYRRLERGKINDPGVRILHNCAIALGVSLYEIIPAQWFHWQPFDDEHAPIPKWEEFFHPERVEAGLTLQVSLAADELESERTWLRARLRGLRKLAAIHRVDVDEPLLAFPLPGIVDFRLGRIVGVLDQAAVIAGDAKEIEMEHLLVAILQEADGVLASVLDDLGVRDELFDRLSES
jgi:transcriptional regulator with XRE-family HTH domain